MDLLEKMPKPDMALGFSPTDDTIAMLKTFIPDSCIYSQFSHEKLASLLSLQRELIRRGKRRSVLIVMDDCLYQKSVLRSTAMRDLFFNGRHLNVGLVCAAQYLMDISPDFRSNIDVLCTMREATINNRQKLHKYFFGQFARFDEFDKVMSACTQNYSALIMDSTVASTKSSDCIFWYRASLDIPSFRLGSSAIWKLSELHRKSDEEVRRIQERQFQAETAAANATGTNSGVTVVQTADETGEVIVE